MRTGINHLFIPGPTNVPESVRQAMNVPMQDHRAHDFGAPNVAMFRDLKALFRTRDGHVLLFPGSGTGAWEAAITNTLSPGDRVLMARHGQFSVLWAQMAERLGLHVDLIDLPWGAGAPISKFARKLGADRKGEIKAVFVTHNETATGVTSDIAAVRRVIDEAFHDALLFVDGVSSIGCLPFEMDGWGVDLAVTGSQKDLMLPPGLGILGVSPKALKASQTATMRRAYFEFSDQINTNETGFSPKPRPCNCCMACAPPWPASPMRVLKTSSPATAASPLGCAPPSRPGGWRCVPKARRSTLTPSPRSARPQASMPAM